MLNFYGSFFYINICGFIGRGKFLYETRVLDNSYLQFKFQLPRSDSTQITAGGPNILALVVSEILWGLKFTLGALCPPVRPLAENFLYPRRVLYYV